MSITIFNKEYDGESLYDLGRDIDEAFIGDYNPLLDEVPVDEHGLQQGKFTVSIVWSEE